MRARNDGGAGTELAVWLALGRSFGCSGGSVGSIATCEGSPKNYKVGERLRGECTKGPIV